jgi:hypothetical protein
VEDPAAAAVALLIALASCRGRMSPVAEEAIRAEMRDVMALPRADETFIFARWVADHANDPNDLVRRFSKLWLGRCSPPSGPTFSTWPRASRPPRAGPRRSRPDACGSCANVSA